jgi:ataxin-3
MFPAPQPVSEIYLAEFLRQLKDEGYGIFVVRGILPDPKGPGHKPPGRNFATLSDSYSGDYGKWVTPTEAASLNKQGEATKKQGLARDAASRAMQRLGGSGNSSFTVAGGGGGFADANAEAEDAELRRAIEASLGGGGGFGAGGTAYGGFGSAGGNVLRHNAHNSSDDDLARALAASLADGGGGLPISSHPVSGSQFTGAKRKTTGETVAAPNAFAEDEDADLAAAIAASIGDGGGGVPSSQNAKDSNSDDARSVVSTPIPPEPEPEVLGAVDIAVRGEGTRARRRFLESDTIDQVEAWVGAVLGLDMRTNMLCTSFPRKALSDGTMSLAQAGVRDKDALAVAPRR